METLAVVMEAPRTLRLSRLELADPGDTDVVVDIDWSGISTGTERLFWTGRMPQFPGMGYPLVPGYESVGRVTAAGSKATVPVGTPVFVPGARCFGEVRGLFGGAASRLVLPEARAHVIPNTLGREAVLLALAATAFHTVVSGSSPELIIGHGILGRLIARITLALGHSAPTVWERNPSRQSGAKGYKVTTETDDTRRDYHTICDVSGDSGLLDRLIARLAPQGEIVLAGFYEAPLTFAFPPAFMREARIRVAAEWKPGDLARTIGLVESGKLSLDGLITHEREATGAPDAYATAFDDDTCLKMILDWRGRA
jgi:3-hydroxyethyl bacteriochlorophyllide a dehydrogenase